MKEMEEMKEKEEKGRNENERNMPAINIFNNTRVQRGIKTKALVLYLASKHCGSQKIKNMILKQ